MSTDVMDYNPDLEAAFNFEANEVGLGLDDLMAEILSNTGKDGESTFDEMKIRRMILAIRHLESETEQLKRFKKAVVADWDRRIKGKEKSIEQIKDTIHDFLVKENNGKGLQLDVATISVRKTPASFVVEKKAEQFLRTYLEESGELVNFLKPGELNVTLAKNELLNRIENKTLPLEDVEHIGTYEPEGTSISIRMK